METIGSVSSIFTCILFISYIIGRLWVNYNARQIRQETFRYETCDLNVDDGMFESRWMNYYNLDGGCELVCISSKQSMRWFKVQRLLYDDKKASLVIEKSYAPIVYINGMIDENEEICLRTLIPEGLPRYRVEFQRSDYIICSFDIGFNGKIGGMSAVDYTMKNTVQSILYYILK